MKDKMRVRFLKSPAYPPVHLVVGKVYDASPSEDGNVLVTGEKGARLLCFLNEVRFVCTGAIA